MARALGALTLASAAAFCRQAAARPNCCGLRARPNLPALLASVTVLSDAAMANEKGAGLQSPAILNDATGHARVHAMGRAESLTAAADHRAPTSR